MFSRYKDMENMKPTRSSVWSTEAEAGSGKDGEWKREKWLDRQKGLS